MREKINEEVSVVMYYSARKRRAVPHIINCQNKDYIVGKIGYRHTIRRGETLHLNYNQPQIMHIDLNSCFAIIEQQANPLIRGKPVGVAAYDTHTGMILAASYEAKRQGVKIMSVREARLLCPDIVIMMPDPAKYRDAHRRFREVLLNYTNEVTPKSIDEFVIDFQGSRAVQAGRSLLDVGYEIKEKIKESLGEYVTVNIGIAPNRFLAKVAAGLHKPDGLDVISGENLLNTLRGIELVDLPGINVRYEARRST